MLRAEAKDTLGLDAFLRGAATLAPTLADRSIKILGPATALIARRADRFRAHLLIECATRSALQRFLSRWLPHVEALHRPSGLRWSIDVDPLEVD
jgi:primosomal protein N' (replication factor Y)